MSTPTGKKWENFKKKTQAKYGLTKAIEKKKGSYPQHKTVDDRSAELHERIQERRHMYGRK